jgi:hypothetical protein
VLIPGWRLNAASRMHQTHQQVKVLERRWKSLAAAPAERPGSRRFQQPLVCLQHTATRDRLNPLSRVDDAAGNSLRTHRRAVEACGSKLLQKLQHGCICHLGLEQRRGCCQANSVLAMAAGVGYPNQEMAHCQSWVGGTGARYVRSQQGTVGILHTGGRAQSAQAATSGMLCASAARLADAQPFNPEYSLWL